MRRSLLLACVFAGCGGDGRGADAASIVNDFSTRVAFDGGVMCGSSQCHAELSQICCVEPSYEFCGSAEACSAGIALYCDGPRDCASGVCCRTSSSTVSCAPTCAGAIVCRADADCPASMRCCGTLAATHDTCAATCD